MNTTTAERAEAALALANSVRTRRAAERKRVRGLSHAEGQATLARLLEEPPEWLASEPLGRFLTWPAHTGRSTTAGVLAQASMLAGRYISSEARADELDEDEKDILVGILRGERVRALVHVCADCGVERHYQAFGRHGNTTGGWRDHRGTHRRSYCRSCQRIRDLKRHAKKKNTLGPDVVLPVEPFAQWLERKMKLYQAEHCRGRDEFATTLGMQPRRFNMYVKREQRSVSMRIVDRVLTHEGSTGLWELYGELYPDVVEEVA